MGSWDSYVLFCRERGLPVTGPIRGSGSGSGSGSGTPFSAQPLDDTEDQFVPETEQQQQIPEDHPLQRITIDDLLHAPGRDQLTKLDPKLRRNTEWFGYNMSITKSVKKIIESDLDGPYTSWKEVPGDVRERWFKAFIQKYNWDFGITTLVRNQFDDVVKTRLKDYVYEWSKKPRDKKLAWMRDSVWTGYIRIWEADEERKKRGKQNSKNRMSDRGGYGPGKHTSGATSYVRRQHNMRDPDTGVLPDMVYFMEETHKSNGVFVDKKAEAISRRCRELEAEQVTQMTQAGAPADYSLSQQERDRIFSQASERRKGKLYGVGSIPFDPEAGGVSSTQDSYDEELRETKKELVEAQQQITQLQQNFQEMSEWATFFRQQFPDFHPRAAGPPNAPPAPGAGPSDGDHVVSPFNLNDYQ